MSVLTTVERVISETFGADNNLKDEVVNKRKIQHRRIKLLSDSEEDTTDHFASVNSSESIVCPSGRHRKEDVSPALVDPEDEDAGSSDRPSGQKTLKKIRLRTLSSSEDDSSDIEKKPKKSERKRKRDVMVEKIKKRYNKKSVNANSRHKTSADDSQLIQKPQSHQLNLLESEMDQELNDHQKVNIAGQGLVVCQKNLEHNISEKLSALCDSDDSASDGGSHSSNHEMESEIHINAIKAKFTKGHTLKKESKSPIMENKPREDQRHKMTAKQAMENMQKIMSDSSRMLREKDISLPYHRPKQFSLKDLLTRSKPILAPNGKSMPLKMNQRQLEEYAKQLEERQKEIIELTKSDSEDEEDTTEKVDMSKTSSATMMEEVEAPTLICANDNTQKISELSETNINSTLKPSEEHSDITFDECIKSHGSQIVTAATKIVETELDPNPAHPIQHEENIQKSINSESEQTLKDVSITPINLEATSEGQNFELRFDSEKFSLGAEDQISENSTKNDKENCSNSANEKSESQNFELRFDSEKFPMGAEGQVSENSTKNDKDNSSNLASDTNNSLKQLSDNDVSSLGQVTEIDVVRKEIVVDINSDKSVHANNVSIETDTSKKKNFDDDDYYNFSDDEFAEDVDMSNIDEIMTQIENAKGQTLSQPKLTGAPGTMIDLDPQKKKTGLDRLKERFCYFSQMKSVEEIEREKEKKVKPGTQHQRLKEMLQEQIAIERSREWAKRLEEEKIRSKENDSFNDNEDDELEKLEAEIEDKEGNINECDGTKKDDVDNPDESSSEEEPEINDVRISDKKRKKKNSLIDDEAEVDEEINEFESEVNYEASAENKNAEINQEKVNDSDDNDGDDDDGDDESSESDSSTEESSSDEADEAKPKKRRIVRAFEDSDDEIDNNTGTSKNPVDTSKTSDDLFSSLSNRDDEITSGQKCNSIVEDLSFSEDKTATPADPAETPQPEVKTGNYIQPNKDHEAQSSGDLFLLEEGSKFVAVPVMASTQQNPSQTIGDDVLQLCSGQFQDSSSNLLQQLSVEEQTNAVDIASQQQEESLGEDILALCTGKFVDNQFMPPKSKPSETKQAEATLSVPATESPNIGEDILSLCTGKFVDNQFISQGQNDNASKDKTSVKQRNLDLLDDDDDNSDPRKFFDVTTNNDALDKTLTANFAGDVSANGGNEISSKDAIMTKKKLVIESDDEGEVEKKEVRRKRKKKRLEDRALQISDDEDEFEPDDMSDLEDNSDEDKNDEEEREVEYDSEENEIEATTKVGSKKVSKFFENEAELSSEEDWVGSGDEDERGLDRMEREEGDDDVFHQGDLRKQLEKIHMRDVLDQDKREVRLLQEILLEDGDLGGGQRQRKFRWKDADAGLDAGTDLGEFAESQEEEFESEEQWRRQRHERLVYLKQMMEQKTDDDTLAVSFTTTEYVTAGLTSRATVLEASTVNAKEKKTPQDVPSPVKKPFNIIQARGAACSLLSRGAGTLARLAALAEPLAAVGQADQPASRLPSKRNFVFATLSPSQKEEQPKVTIKRKNTAKAETPTMMKKLKTSEGDKKSRLSLLDKLNT